MAEKPEIINLIKKINLKLILGGYTLRDKLKVIIRFFLLAPLRKLGITKKEMLITMKNEDGIFVCGDKTISATSPVYEQHLKKHFDTKKGIFIDVGANLGKYTIMMGRRLGDKGVVVAIEPEQHTLKLLRRNIKINNLKNVFVIEKACSNKNGKATFYLEGTTYSGGTHSLKKDKQHVGEITINVETLDSIISRLKLKGVNLIKIDVEGSEVNVLKGAQQILKKDHPKIICESLSKESEKEIQKLLKKFKYNVKRIHKENVLAY